MFDDILQQIESKLDIPYPRRTLVLQELEADLWAHYSALLEEGFSEAQARDATLRDMELDADTVASLQAIHNPVIRRILLRLPEPAREPTEWIAAALPIIASFYFLLTEVPMIDFLHEAGSAVWFVLFIGGIALLLQVRRAFSWFVARNHSPASLAKNTATPLYLAAATLILSIEGTAVGLYVVLKRWSEGVFPGDVAIIGFKETLVNLIVGASLTTLIVLVHGALQAGLRAVRARAV